MGCLVKFQIHADLIYGSSGPARPTKTQKLDSILTSRGKLKLFCQRYLYMYIGENNSKNIFLVGKDLSFIICVKIFIYKIY